MSASSYSIAVLGDGGTGKTCFVVRGVFNVWTEIYDPTIEDMYMKKVVVDGHPCTLSVLDTAGQEEYSTLRDQWIRECDAAIILYSITSRATFDRLEVFRQNVVRIGGENRPSYPIFIVGNKSDKHYEREVSSQEGYLYAKKKNCEFRESSARNNENGQVEGIFLDMVRVLRASPGRPKPVTLEEAAVDIPETLLSSKTKRNFLEAFKSGLGFKSAYVTKPTTREEQNALNTCLVNAARKGDQRAVKKLLRKGADSNAQAGADGSAVHVTAAHGFLKQMEILVKSGGAVNAIGPRQETPLQVASLEGHSEMVKWLLKQGARVNEVSGLHGTALCAAASRSRLKVIRALIRAKPPANANIQGGPYGNALQAAALMGSAEVVQALLDHGANMQARGEGDCTALQVAAFAGNVEVVKLLLHRQSGIDVDARGGRLGTAVEAANNHGHAQVLRLLLDHQATQKVNGETRPSQQLDLQATTQRNQPSVQSFNQDWSDDEGSRSTRILPPSWSSNAAQDFRNFSRPQG